MEKKVKPLKISKYFLCCMFFLVNFIWINVFLLLPKIWWALTYLLNALLFNWAWLFHAQPYFLDNLSSVACSMSHYESQFFPVKMKISVYELCGWIIFFQSFDLLYWGWLDLRLLWPWTGMRQNRVGDAGMDVFYHSLDTTVVFYAVLWNTIYYTNNHPRVASVILYQCMVNKKYGLST